MRGLRLAGVAAQAEALRLRRAFRRHAARAALALCAAVFLIAALAGLHVAAAIALLQRYSAVTSLLIVIAADLLIATAFALVAARDRPGAVEREALRVRRLAVGQALESVAILGLVASLRRVRSLREAFGLLLAAGVAWGLGMRR